MKEELHIYPLSPSSESHVEELDLGNRQAEAQLNLAIQRSAEGHLSVKYQPRDLSFLSLVFYLDFLVPTNTYNAPFESSTHHSGRRTWRRQRNAGRETPPTIPPIVGNQFWRFIAR